MNKAFVREPDETGQLHCPACGSLGLPVQRETWQAHVAPEAAGALATSALFCPYPKCEVVYFDMFERRVTVDALTHGVWPKDPQAPLCGCFGLTADDVADDVREGSVARVKALIERAKSPEAHCTTLAASGTSCIGEVQRYYMKLRSAAAGQPSGD